MAEASRIRKDGGLDRRFKDNDNNNTNDDANGEDNFNWGCLLWPFKAIWWLLKMIIKILSLGKF